MKTVIEPRKLLAGVGATAWLNASIASGQDDARPALYRTLAVEFFPAGVQFVGCDGTALFRTWAPYSDNGDLPSRHPEWNEAPEDSVVVSDVDKFAVGFMRTLLSAVTDVPVEVSLSVEPADEGATPALGEELRKYVLVLSALGQRLSCRLFDGPFPDWRNAQFGLDVAERVDGMTLATRLFAAVGKLKGVGGGVDCSFHGQEKAIAIATRSPADPSVRGLLMPMRRLEKAEPTKPDDGQRDISQAADRS